MIEIQILGTGCPTCENLAKMAEETAQELGLQFSLTKVRDIDEITSFGVMATPALVVDGDVKVSGRLPGKDELSVMLKG